jgi:hypothetical protein
MQGVSRHHCKEEAGVSSKKTIVKVEPCIEHKENAGKYCPCPKCGKLGKRKRTKKRSVRHLAHKRPAYWQLLLGVYVAACTCCKYFTATITGVMPRALYTDEVRQKVVDLLIRDHLSVYKVQQHLKEDFLLDVSIGFIYDCFQWAYNQIDRTAYWAWVLRNFSGVLCIDEVHEGARTLLVATDPLNDFTVAFAVVDANTQAEMNNFLDTLKKRGLQSVSAAGRSASQKAIISKKRGLLNMGTSSEQSPGGGDLCGSPRGEPQRSIVINH